MCRNTITAKQECFLIMKTIFHLPPPPKEGGDIQLNIARFDNCQWVTVLLKVAFAKIQ
jgi:hypothetical protein